MTTFLHIRSSESEHEIASNLDTVGWGAFFVWVGIAFLADVGWGPGLFGVAIIMFAVQAGRKYFDLRVEWFALLLAAVLAVSGIARWLDLTAVTASLPAFILPLMFIAVGVAILISVWKHWPHE
jgi:hypothetical protein